MKRSARDPRYLAVLALSAGVILVVGNWLRPDSGGDEGQSQVMASDSSLLQLPRLTQRRAIEDRVEFITRAVTGLDRYIYRLEGAGQSAVLWNAATLVTSRGARRIPSEDDASGGVGQPLEVATNRAGPHLPLALIDARLELPPFPIQRVAASSSSPGSWLLVAWRGRDGALAWSEGQYLRTRREDCGDLMPAQTLTSTVRLEPDMAGAGVFTIDGALVGIVGRCDDGPAILSTQAVELLAGRELSLADRLLYRYGMRVDLPTDAERSALRAEQGLLVHEVWEGYQGFASGLRPGDTILSIDGNEISTVAELEKLVLPVAQEVFSLAVLSQRRPRTVELRARPEVEPEMTRGGAVLARTDQSVPIAYVGVEGDFASARARAGDRLLSLDGTPMASSQEVERYLERAKGPVWATFQREVRLWGALLPNE